MSVRERAFRTLAMLWRAGGCAGQRMDSGPDQAGLMSTSNEPGHRPRSAWEIPAGLCRRSVRTLSRRLRDVPGVVSFEVDAGRGLVWVDGDADPAELDTVVQAISCS